MQYGVIFCNIRCVHCSRGTHQNGFKEEKHLNKLKTDKSEKKAENPAWKAREESEVAENVKNKKAEKEKVQGSKVEGEIRSRKEQNGGSI